jgi:hypothetical protein
MQKNDEQAYIAGRAYFLAFRAAAQRLRCASAILARASGLSLRLVLFLAAAFTFDTCLESAILLVRARRLLTSRSLAISSSIASMIDLLPIELSSHLHCTGIDSSGNDKQID